MNAISRFPAFPFPGLWRNANGDYPVIIIGDLGDASGRHFVKAQGSDAGIPADEVSPLNGCRFGGGGILFPDLPAIRRNLPELVALDHWIIWRAVWTEQKGGKCKYNKVPINPRTLGNAQSNNPETWASFEEAGRAYLANADQFAGIGFMLDAPDTAAAESLNLCGFDFDGVFGAGDDASPASLPNFERGVLETLSTYTEISPTGTGLRAFGRGLLPPQGRKKGNFECYNSGRFLTVTGHSLHDAPLPMREVQDAINVIHPQIFGAKSKAKPEPKVKAAPTKATASGFKLASNGRSALLTDDQLLFKAFNSQDGADIRKLWNGNWSAYDDGEEGQSRADLALANYLVFYANGDKTQVDRLFRQSALYRDKWDEKRGPITYGELTISRALEGRSEVDYYKPGYTPNSASDREANSNGLDESRAIAAELPGLLENNLKELYAPRIMHALADLKYNSAGDWAIAANTLKQRGQLRAVEAEIKKQCPQPRRPLRLVSDDDQPELQSVDDSLTGAPLEGLSVPYSYSLSYQSLDKIVDTTDGPKPIRIAPGPVLIVGRTLSIGDYPTEGYRVAWFRSGEGWRSIVVDAGDIFDKSRILTLIDRGFPVTSSTAKDLVDFFAAFAAVNRQRLPVVRTTSQMGWQGKRGELGVVAGRVFIKPDGEVVETSDLNDPEGWREDLIQYRAFSPGEEQLVAGYKREGSLEQWKEAVAVIKDYSMPRVAFYASFTSVMLMLLKCPNFTVDLAGLTSKGKTTSQMIAASVWGGVDERGNESNLHSWDSTKVGAERLSAVINHLPTILNDTSRAPKPEVVKQMLYQVEEGKGRTRGTRTGIATTPNWHTVMISSGERRITDFAPEGGGVINRVIQLYGAPFGDRNEELVVKLRGELQDHHGHAGIEFARWVILNKDQKAASGKTNLEEWREEYKRERQAYIRTAESGSDASRLAEFAAALKVTAGLVHQALDLEWEFADPLANLWGAISEGAKDPLGAARALDHLLTIAATRPTQFYGRHLLHDDRRTPKEPAGGWFGVWDEGDDYKFIAFSPVRLRDVLTALGLDYLAIIEQWRKHGWLDVAPGRKDFKKQKGMNGDKVWLYVINRAAISELATLMGGGDERGDE